MNTYLSRLFHLFRLVPVNFITDEISQESMLKAMTVNEELLQLGYTLSPADIIALSKTKELDNFYDYIEGLHGNVCAEPMYPGFPEEVMNMDEAVFRFHQMLHYLSTYGMEMLTGNPVLKGWIPESDAPERIEKDRIILDAKVAALLDMSKIYSEPYRIILSRTERMKEEEREIINICLKNLDIEQIKSVNIRFKENLYSVFCIIFENNDLTSEQKIKTLHEICQHTGDVFKCIGYVLARKRYHLRTSQKRLLVKLIESYPESDLKANLVISLKKSRETEKILRFIDYTTYSRNEKNTEYVNMLRDGKLHSWESQLKNLVSLKDPNALSYISKRPGMAVRMLTYLLRNGYTAEDIENILVPEARHLKTQTLITLLNHFGRKTLFKNREEGRVVYHICEKLLSEKLSSANTALKNKKVCISLGDIAPEYSSIEISSTGEASYLNSGIAYKIPDEARKIRFFVYWNDKQRVDIDLHSAGVMPDGSITAIGWNGSYKSESMAFSGDMTDSDSAEYIDVDLDNSEITAMTASVNLYYGYDKNTLKDVEVCFAGCMVVNELGEEIELYNPANCLFVNHLHPESRCIQYGFIDIKQRTAVFIGKPSDSVYTKMDTEPNMFNLKKYLDILCSAQNIKITEDPQQADLILVTGKPASEKEISLADENFFMDYKE